MGKYFYSSLVILPLTTGLVLWLCFKLLDHELTIQEVFAVTNLEYQIVTYVLAFLVPISIVVTYLGLKEVEYEKDVAYTDHEEFIAILKKRIMYINLGLGLSTLLIVILVFTQSLV